MQIYKVRWGEVAQSCSTLWDPVDCNLLGFSVHGILQARILEWIAISFSRGSSRSRDRARVSRIEGRRFNLWATREACRKTHKLIDLILNFCHCKVVPSAAAKSIQSCPTLCDPIDGRLSGSLLPGILQARTLEWVAISFSNAWKWKVKVKSLSRVQLFVTPGTGPPGFFRQEYWSGLPFPSPGDLPDPGIETGSPTLQADALTSEQPGKQENKQVDARVEGGGRMNETGEEE